MTGQQRKFVTLDCLNSLKQDFFYLFNLLKNIRLHLVPENLYKKSTVLEKELCKTSFEDILIKFCEILNAHRNGLSLVL